MANEPSKTQTPQPQAIPLAKIHDLPGAVISKQPDKSYGGLVTSIQAGGVKEPVVLRLREDGEYQLVTGYRRRRACEVAKLKDIPALVYEMSMPSALNYHRQVKNQPDIPIPGKPVLPAAPDKNGPTADLKGPEKPTTPTPAQGQEKPNQEKAPTQSSDPAAADKAKDGAKPDQEPKPAAQSQEKPSQEKAPTQSSDPAAADKAKDGVKPAQEPEPAAVRAALAEYGIENGEVVDPAKLDTNPFIQQIIADVERLEKLTQEQGQEKPVQEKGPAQAPAPAVTGPAAKGPVGTAIAQTLPERLSPPDEAAKKDFPAPQEGESIFVVLHPSSYNKFQVNKFSISRLRDARDTIAVGQRGQVL